MNGPSFQKDGDARAKNMLESGESRSHGVSLSFLTPKVFSLFVGDF